ncbi:uncharacterized protein [Aegilops tauschii subsp. strangulata]|uniref:uncharacterized protein n=1 Tax=Aegilops tauschii subsp. strangulata TaxID=200361 RepID=UPI003CC863BC
MTGTVLDDLPEEIVVGNILVLLPPKDVGRCRAVRASWLSATSTPEFMLNHHRHQPSLPVIELENHLGVFRGSADARPPCQLLSPFHPFVRIHAAGDGFLVVSQLVSSRFLVCNPAIHQNASLPQPEIRPSNAVLAIYRHNPTGEYRVLWSSLVEVDCGRHETTLHALTVGGRQSRNITVSSSSLQHELLEALPRDRHSAKYPPAHLCGNLHWMWMFRAQIIVFDTVAESFRLMRSATTDSHNCLHKLFDVEGKLALCSPDSCFQYMGVWMMDDYVAEIWDLEYRIDVSSMEASRPLNLASPNKKKEKENRSQN